MIFKFNLKLRISLIENCPWVEEDYVPNGHDCWGNIEFSRKKYVNLKGRPTSCWDGQYVLYNTITGEIKELFYDWERPHKLKI